MSGRLADTWVTLSTTPLVWLTLTLAAYLLALGVSRRLGRHPLANPVAIASALLVGVLTLTRTDYETYFAGAQFIHFLLGPATVALAVPLHRNLPAIRANALPMVCALVAGSVTAIVVAVAVARALGAPHAVVVSLAPKSVTTPIAMGLSERLGGIPTLTAALVIATGIFGAVIVTPLMNALGLRDFAARGFSAGLAAHGIGTARAFEVHPLAGAFAGVAIGLNGAVTAIVLPLLAPWLF